MTLRGHGEAVTSLAALDREAHFLASGSHDRTVRIWSLMRERCVRVLGDQNGDDPMSAAVNALAVLVLANNNLSNSSEIAGGNSTSRRQILASGSNDGRVSLWNWKSGECELRVQMAAADSVAAGVVSSLSSVGDGSELAVSVDGE